MSTQKNLLIVDDAPENLQLLVEILEPEGFEVRPADSGALALMAAKARVPDLVLLDIRMEGLDGFEVCRRLKAAEATRMVPVILLSAYAESSEWAEGLRLGAVDFITKPFNAQELLVRVRTHLGLAGLQQKLSLQRREMQQETDLLRSAMDHVDACIYIKDPESRYLYGNKATMDLFGLDPEQLLGHLDEDFRDRATAQNLREIDQQVLSGMTNTAEVVFHEPDGSSRTYWESKSRLLDPNDPSRVVGLIGISTDITLRKQAAEALKESEERLALVLEGSQLGYWDWDIPNNRLIRNDHWAKMLGYAPDELAPSFEQWKDLLHPDDRDRALQSLQNHLEGRTLEHRVEYRMQTKDGGFCWILDQAKVVKRDEHGRPLRMCGTHAEVTGLKQAEASLRESEDRFRHVFENSPVGKSITRFEGEISVNQAFAEMLGYTREELSGLHWKQITHPDDIAATQAMIDPLLLGSSSSGQIQKRYIHHDGTTVWADVRTTLRRDAQGRPMYFMTTVYDISLQKRLADELEQHRLRLEEEVRQRTVELESFTYSISHDLRAPLRSITGYCEALEEDCGEMLNQTARTYLDRIQGAGQRMDTLICDLLRLSRVTTQDCLFQSVDLSRLAEDVCANLSSQHSEFPIAWEVAPDLTCHGDLQLLRIAFENLLGNAWKFSAGSPQPRVVVECGGPGEVRIRDNGAGFPHEKADQLFVPFRRLHHESQFAGTGLGLAIVRRVMARHGGSVEAEGSLGQGACFTLRFPFGVPAVE